jgi:hypothetical protein
MILVSVHVTSENPTAFDLEMKKLIEAGKLAEAKQLLSCTLGEEDSPWRHLFAMGAATVAPKGAASASASASASAATAAGASSTAAPSCAGTSRPSSASSCSAAAAAASSGPATTRRDFLTNLVWLEKHYESYEGQWVALRDGVLVNHAPDLSTLHQRLTLSNELDCMLVDV